MKWIVRVSSSETNPRPPRKPSRRSGRRDSLSFERAELSRDDERRVASFEPRASVAPLPQCLFRTTPFGRRPTFASLRSAHRRRGTAERRSPFQSARDRRWITWQPGGLKGRGRVREARRSRRHAPRARESVALPVTQAPQRSEERSEPSRGAERSEGPRSGERRAPRAVSRATGAGRGLSRFLPRVSRRHHEPTHTQPTVNDSEETKTRDANHCVTPL